MRTQLLAIIGLGPEATEQQIIHAFMHTIRTKDLTLSESEEDARILDAYEKLFATDIALGRTCGALHSIYHELNQATPALHDELARFAELKFEPLERVAYNMSALNGYQFLDKESCDYLVAHLNAQSDGMYNTEILKFIFSKLVNKAGLSLPHSDQCNLLYYSGLIKAFKKLSGDPTDDDSWTPATEHILTQARLNYLMTHASVAEQLAGILEQISKKDLLNDKNEEFVLFLCKTQDEGSLERICEALSTSTTEQAIELLDQLQQYRSSLERLTTGRFFQDSDDSDDDEAAETKREIGADEEECKIRPK